MAAAVTSFFKSASHLKVTKTHSLFHGGAAVKLDFADQRSQHDVIASGTDLGQGDGRIDRGLAVAGLSARHAAAAKPGSGRGEDLASLVRGGEIRQLSARLAEISCGGSGG